MSMPLGYQFTPVPTHYKDRMFKELRGATFKVLDFCLTRICSFPSTRQIFQGEFSHRFIADKIGINHGNVGRVFKQLEAKGFIKIIKIGKNKVGTIIRILIEKFTGKVGGETSSNNGIPTTTSCTSTAKPEVLGVPVRQPIESKSTRIIDQPTPPSQSINDIDSYKNNNIIENNKKETSLTVKKENYINNDAKNIITLAPSSQPELPCQAAIPAITEKAVTIGCNILKTAGFDETTGIIQDIIKGMQKVIGNVQNINGYFVKSCKNHAEKYGNNRIVTAATAVNTNMTTQRPVNAPQGNPTGATSRVNTISAVKAVSRIEDDTKNTTIDTIAFVEKIKSEEPEMYRKAEAAAREKMGKLWKFALKPHQSLEIKKAYDELIILKT